MKNVKLPRGISVKGVGIGLAMGIPRSQTCAYGAIVRKSLNRSRSLLMTRGIILISRFAQRFAEGAYDDVLACSLYGLIMGGLVAISILLETQ
jgi:hypothetical protein